MHDLWEAVGGGAASIEHKSIEILNTVLLVMMTMEIVLTVAISLQSHTKNAEPFLIIGSIAAIRRMLVITATSTENEANPAAFRNTLVELGLLAATVIAMTYAIYILRLNSVSESTWTHSPTPPRPRRTRSRPRGRSRTPPREIIGRKDVATSATRRGYP